jgi:ABC-2 family transporter protein
MIRFAWLQSRTSYLTGFAILAVLAVITAVTGPHLAHLYNTDVVGCATHGDCADQLEQFFQHDLFLQNALQFSYRLVPAIIGIFWGAPLLAREFETGTFRVAWTQSVSRSHWVLTKLALGALASVIAAGVYSLTVTWWFRAFDLANDNLHSFTIFDQRDLVDIGYTLFAFAVGALIGAVLRRVVPAMAATLGAFVLVRVGIAVWVRPHFRSPLHRTASMLDGGFGIESSNGSHATIVAKPADLGNDWVIHSHLVNNAGQPVSNAASATFLQQHCPTIARAVYAPPPTAVIKNGHKSVRAAPNPAAFHSCQVQASHVFHLLVTYQPASRFWPFQWIETGVFGILGLAALAICYWWVTRRIA